MKTIYIQNCTDNKDSSFKVVVNNETHIMRHQFLRIHVADDQPLEIRAKYIWDGSPKYTFKPEDNMSLQILVNMRMMRFWGLLAIGISLPIIIANIVKSFGIEFDIILLVSGASFLFLVYLLIIRRKKFFVIQEVPKTDKLE